MGEYTSTSLDGCGSKTRLCPKPRPVRPASLTPPGHLAEAGRTKVPLPRAPSSAAEACPAPFWPDRGWPCYRQRGALEATRVGEDGGGERGEVRVRVRVRARVGRDGRVRRDTRLAASLTCAGGRCPVQSIPLRADVPRQQHVVILKVFAHAFQVPLDGRKLSLELARALRRLALRLGRRPDSRRLVDAARAQALDGVRCEGPGLQLLLKLHSKGHELGSSHDVPSRRGWWAFGWAAGRGG
eukprot:scaffold112729_cov57-Phaeocystis_antarctica.AAC.1